MSDLAEFLRMGMRDRFVAIFNKLVRLEERLATLEDWHTLLEEGAEQLIKDQGRREGLEDVKGG